MGGAIYPNVVSRVVQLTASAMLVVARMCVHAASPSERCGSVELLRRELTWSRGRSFNLRIDSTLEATQGQNHSLFSQLPYKCYLEEVASVGD